MSTEADAECLAMGEMLQHRSSCPADSLFLQTGTCKSTFLLASEMQKPQQSDGGAGLLPWGGFLLQTISELFALDLCLAVSNPPGLSVPSSLLLALGLVSQAL